MRFKIRKNILSVLLILCKLYNRITRSHSFYHVVAFVMSMIVCRLRNFALMSTFFYRYLLLTANQATQKIQHDANTVFEALSDGKSFWTNRIFRGNWRFSKPTDDLDIDYYRRRRSHKWLIMCESPLCLKRII